MVDSAVWRGGRRLEELAAQGIQSVCRDGVHWKILAEELNEMDPRSLVILLGLRSAQKKFRGLKNSQDQIAQGDLLKSGKSKGLPVRIQAILGHKISRLLAQFSQENFLHIL